MSYAAGKMGRKQGAYRVLGVGMGVGEGKAERGGTRVVAPHLVTGKMGRQKGVYRVRGGRGGSGSTHCPKPGKLARLAERKGCT